MKITQLDFIEQNNYLDKELTEISTIYTLLIIGYIRRKMFLFVPLNNNAQILAHIHHVIHDANVMIKLK